LKGIIFNLAEEVVVEAFGEDAWDSILDAAGLEGSYTSLGNYPDGDLLSLVQAASAALNAPADVVVRTIGQGALPRLASRYPEFFTSHTSTRPFLLTINNIIHAEVRKLYPDADLPVFEFETVDTNGPMLLLAYRSKRRLCALAEGFILGAAAHYGEQVEIDQPECMNRGDDRCVLRCAFTTGAGSEGGPSRGG
jgi:hypothetical protein